jgi:uncharacterized protein (DUF4415 family)
MCTSAPKSPGKQASSTPLVERLVASGIKYFDPADVAVARKGLKAVPKKALLSLRVDADVIDWFKAQAAGYQSRMNALLRAYMEAHK